MHWGHDSVERCWSHYKNLARTKVSSTLSHSLPYLQQQGHILTNPLTHHNQTPAALACFAFPEAKPAPLSSHSLSSHIIPSPDGRLTQRQSFKN